MAADCPLVWLAVLLFVVWCVCVCVCVCVCECVCVCLSFACVGGAAKIIRCEGYLPFLPSVFYSGLEFIKENKKLKKKENTLSTKKATKIKTKKR